MQTRALCDSTERDISRNRTCAYVCVDTCVYVCTQRETWVRLLKWGYNLVSTIIKIIQMCSKSTDNCESSSLPRSTLGNQEASAFKKTKLQGTDFALCKKSNERLENRSIFLLLMLTWCGIFSFKGVKRKCSQHYQSDTRMTISSWKAQHFTPLF